MTVACDCSCGASLTVEDASEVACAEVLRWWGAVHGEHRRTPQEYAAWISAVHQRPSTP